MLDTILTSTTGESLTLTNTLIILVVSIILGLIISISYMKTSKEEVVTSGFAITLIMLPAIISIIILLVGNNVARAFSLAGAFSIIRFRSEPKDPKDISYIFFTLAVGLSAGMGYILYAILFTIILCLIMFVLKFINYAESDKSCLELRITIPENLNYENIFDDILKKYTSSWKFKKIKTKEFGSLFEITYSVVMNTGNQKKFIDEVRCRNGNLGVILSVPQEKNNL
ncbi:MAG: DUF4956 domain-containing protein [Clostridium sp.]|nr:DUF4956 domain-containing protein [Clostridium sp.]MCI7442347.1 DUF4956 domain-containing protein [Clostridium sp.]